MTTYFKVALFMSICLLSFAGLEAGANYTPQELSSFYEKGQAQGAKYMLVVWDTWDFEDSYQFIEYSYPDDDLDALITYYSAPGFYRVKAVYELGQDTPTN